MKKQRENNQARSFLIKKHIRRRYVLQNRLFYDGKQLNDNEDKLWIGQPETLSRFTRPKISPEIKAERAQKQTSGRNKQRK